MTSQSSSPATMFGSDWSTSPFQAWLAPWQFAQSILSGSSFGNIIVNEQNSRAPDTERRIVQHASYGRQLGRLSDAVCELIAERQGEPKPAFTALEALQDEIKAIKTAAAKGRLENLRQDLELLRLNDPTAYAEELAALKSLIGG